MHLKVAGHGIVWTASCCRKCCTIRAPCGLALSWTLACQPTHDCRNGGLCVETAHGHGIFGLSDYHQERTSRKPPPSGNVSVMTHKTSTVDITSSSCSIWLVTWSFGVDYSHMETGPLVWWNSFFAMSYRRSCKGFAPTKHFISGQPYFQYYMPFYCKNTFNNIFQIIIKS
jgi:hypothetical protein